MKKILFYTALLVVSIPGKSPAQRPLRATLLSDLPKSSICSDSVEFVAAAPFRLQDAVNKRFAKGDTFWVWIACPENFTRGLWHATSLYELQLDSDTSTIAGLPRLSVPAKAPIGIVRTARRIVK